MERRSFIKSCTLLCAGGLLAASLLDGCTPVYYAASMPDGNRLRVKRSEFTDEKGKLRAFVVVRSEKLEFPCVVYLFVEDVFVALSTKCTHSGCEVQPNKTSLVCPCHGSEFSNRGKVLSPPAETDLKQYTVTTDNENIYIQL